MARTGRSGGDFELAGICTHLILLVLAVLKSASRARRADLCACSCTSADEHID
jgi:hypothetical protein